MCETDVRDSIVASLVRENWHIHDSYTGVNIYLVINKLEMPLWTTLHSFSRALIMLCIFAASTHKMKCKHWVTAYTTVTSTQWWKYSNIKTHESSQFYGPQSQKFKKKAPKANNLLILIIQEKVINNNREVCNLHWPLFKNGNKNRRHHQTGEVIRSVYAGSKPGTLLDNDRTP